ncbi:hypothetical protein NQ314_012135 [Rhamnusium bicolor]|uniref:DUF4817 domain-containing protein n=1 Tax=Rhamnusium bicolor TaxID=1586634 RepID=A0AAV8XD49_9CUCU|nr:hypothetical protein NQ314_012135 [Rhamnusium bicolor]
MKFTQQELTDMIYCLGEADRNCLLASRIYGMKYPERRTPDPNSFKNLRERFEDTGNVCYTKRKLRNMVVNNEEHELTVLLHVQENPHISCREIEQQTDVNKTSVNRIINKYKYHPYHIQLHQDLYGEDFQNRINFCNIMLNKINEDAQFYQRFYLPMKLSFAVMGQ